MPPEERNCLLTTAALPAVPRNIIEATSNSPIITRVSRVNKDCYNRKVKLETLLIP